jgi:hypothetical protein
MGNNTKSSVTTYCQYPLFDAAELEVKRWVGELPELTELPE